MKSKCIHTWTQYEQGAECDLLVAGIVLYITGQAEAKEKQGGAFFATPHSALTYQYCCKFWCFYASVFVRSLF